MEELDTSNVFVVKSRYDVCGDFDEIVGSFPRLISLKMGYARPLHASWNGRTPPSLKHFSYECQHLTRDDLAWINELAVQSLEILFRFPCQLLALPLPRLNSLTKLALVYNPCDEDWTEETVWNHWIVKIIDSCPNITSLRLFDPNIPDYRTLLSGIEHSALLTSLTLDSPPLVVAHSFYCDNLFHRFPNLTHLSLCDESSSIALALNLLYLQNLLSLRLGPGVHAMFVDHQLLNLVQGTTRHPTLRHLILDCFNGRIGRRIQADEEVRNIYQQLTLEEDGWKNPSFHNITEGGLTRLFDACRENGIEVGGGDVNVIEARPAYLLEFANRSVLRSFQHHTLDGLDPFLSTKHFPHIPVENLDPQNLQLTKTYDPETKWFKLGLESK